MKLPSIARLSSLIGLVAALAMPTVAQAGAIFVTGHDPIWHSNFGGNAAGAAKLAKAGIDYARQGSSAKFLYIESKGTTPTPGNAFTAPFLGSALGYSGQYDVMNGAELAALTDFGATLSTYSAIVVASDHGGMLTTAELSFLNGNSATILAYLNAGGGLYAEAESNAVGNIGTTQRFGFLPFLVSSSDFGAFETGNTVTALGTSLGLVNSDVNGNFSHNYFASTGGMTAVDYFNGDTSKALTLAYSGQIGVTGVVPEPGTLALLLAAGVAGWSARRRR